MVHNKGFRRSLFTCLLIASWIFILGTIAIYCNNREEFGYFLIGAVLEPIAGGGKFRSIIDLLSRGTFSLPLLADLSILILIIWILWQCHVIYQRLSSRIIAYFSVLMMWTILIPTFSIKTLRENETLLIEHNQAVIENYKIEDFMASPVTIPAMNDPLGFSLSFTALFPIELPKLNNWNFFSAPIIMSTQPKMVLSPGKDPIQNILVEPGSIFLHHREISDSYQSLTEPNVTRLSSNKFSFRYTLIPNYLSHLVTDPENSNIIRICYPSTNSPRRLAQPMEEQTNMDSPFAHWEFHFQREDTYTAEASKYFIGSSLEKEIKKSGILNGSFWASLRRYSNPSNFLKENFESCQNRVGFEKRITAHQCYCPKGEKNWTPRS